MTRIARETKCKHIRLDGNRCKLIANEREYLCEHHAYDFYYFVRNPITVTKMYRRYWGKAHHPACDRKGTLLCECPNISDGAIMFQALKRACKMSASRTKIAKAVEHLEMLIKVRKIKKYYMNLKEEDIVLPPDSNWRQFRIFVYDRQAKRVVVKKVKDCIRTSKDLLKHLRRHAPLNVYYSTSTWLNPQSIGPDPFSKSGRRKFKKKNLMKHYHNTWLGQGFFIDVDYEMKDSTMAAKMTEKVIEWYLTNVNPDADLTLVRSGGKGFHVIDYDYNIVKDMENHLPNSKPLLELWNKTIASHEMQRYESTKMTPSGVKQHINKEWKRGIVEKMKRDGLLVDFEVTPDPRRIIRVPGTVHGKRLTVCEVISQEEIYVSARAVQT